MEGHSHGNMEGPCVIEEGILVDLANTREHDISSKMIDNMCNMNENLERIKDDN